MDEYRTTLMKSPKVLAWLTKERCLQLGTLRMFNVGFCDDLDPLNAMGQRVTFPLRDLKGRCVTIQGRAFFDYKQRKVPKYYHGSAASEYEKSDHLYGLFENFELASDLQLLYVVEGPIDVISLRQIGIPAVCPFGTSLSKVQAALILATVTNVVLAFDPDDAGSKGAQNAIRMLSGVPDATLYKVTPHSKGKDPNEIATRYGNQVLLDVMSNAEEVQP